jgi:TnpA family transposase
MVEKKKRGRPRLDITDAERLRRYKAANTKAQQNKKHIAMAGPVGKRFAEAKQAQEKALGFKITHQQFLTILLTRWENDQG